MSAAVGALRDFLARETFGEASCWGLLEEVVVEVPVMPEWRGLEFIDAPGAGDNDLARALHLRQALQRSAMVVLVTDARKLDGDVKRALMESGFLRRLLSGGAADQRLLAVVPGDKVWGAKATAEDLDAKEAALQDTRREEFLDMLLGERIGSRSLVEAALSERVVQLCIYPSRTCGNTKMELLEGELLTERPPDPGHTYRKTYFQTDMSTERRRILCMCVGARAATRRR